MMIRSTLITLCCLAMLFACSKDETLDGKGYGGVYVCTSKSASVWHCRKDCGALSNCDGQIVYTISPGKQYKRACKRCYK